MSVFLHVASTTIAILVQLVYPASVRARFVTEVEVGSPNYGILYMPLTVKNVKRDGLKVSVHPSADAPLTPMPTEIAAPGENDDLGVGRVPMVSLIPTVEPSVMQPSILEVNPPEPVPNPEPPPLSTTEPEKPVVKIGGRVVAAEIIRKESPVYPEAARRAGVQGAVVLNAIVNTRGILQEIQIVSGHPLLIKAALDCVRKWRYRPGTLNEQVIDMPIVIRVQFMLNFR